MNNISNVGIKDKQKSRIIKLLKFGDSINKFVQDAVEKKLLRLEKKVANHDLNEGEKKNEKS